MTMNKSNAGNGLLIAIAIVVLVGAAVAGFVFYKKNAAPMDALPEASEIVTQDEDAVTQEPVATDEQGNAVPDTVEEATSAGPVEIDVEKFFAPRTIGSADAPVKIVEYASLTCSHCAHFHNDVLPALKTKYIDTGKVQFEFREFPLNDPALKGAITARCLPEDKYEGFVTLLFKTQENWAGNLDYMTSLRQNAKLAGMSDETFEACHANNALKTKMAEGMQVAQDKWKISATPTFIINDGAEIISGAQPLAEFERVFRKVSGDAVGEAPAVE